MTLTTCLWSHDMRAVEMSEFYTGAFSDSRITTTGYYNEPNPYLPGSKAGDVMNIEFELMGVQFSVLNGGPFFKIDPSISFFVSSSDKSEITELWEKLSDGGKILMALDNYPWSEWYGWVEDKFGVSWQLFFTEKTLTQRIAPCLSFTQKKVGKAEEAINYYTSVFPDSGINILARYEKGEGGAEGKIKHAQFHLGDFYMSAMDAVGPHTFDFSGAISFMIPCENQEELDYYYDKLSKVPEAEVCGWITDQYGVCWQVIPVNYLEYMKHGEKDKIANLNRNILEMKRLSFAGIDKAYNG